jgi:hypothetical protein
LLKYFSLSKQRYTSPITFEEAPFQSPQKEVLGSAGNVLIVKPVMDSLVSFSMATRGSVETLKLIASIISKESGVTVETLNVPFHLDATITMGAEGEPARDVIKRMGKMVQVPLSFQCLYSPTTKTYSLNVRSVGAPNPPGVPARLWPSGNSHRSDTVPRYRITRLLAD